MVLVMVLPAFTAASAAFAGENTGFLPPAHELFPPLLADPREIQNGVAIVSVHGDRARGEVMIGDLLGVYRMALGEGILAQISGGGGVFARFNMEREQLDNEVADFQGLVPIDIRCGKFSGRFGYQHVSSHLGDDFIKREGPLLTKAFHDSLRFLFAVNPTAGMRLYGGYTYHFRMAPIIKVHAVQGGIEITSPWRDGGHLQWFAAADLQSWERVQWNVSSTTRAGVQWARHPKGQAASVFVEYFTGKLLFDQFFRQHETHWMAGLRFYLS